MHLNDLDGFIFDIDGTLLDSNDAHAEAFRRAFRSSGYTLDFTQIRKLIGMGSDHLIPSLIGVSSESSAGKAIEKKKTEIFQKEFFPELKPFPQAKALIAELSRAGKKLSVATSAGKDDLKKFLEKLEVEEYFHSEVSADDADSSKPDPDLVAAALKRLKLDPERVRMVGDTPYDITAANRAGVKAIAFRTGKWKDEALRNAEMIVDGPAALLDAFKRG